VRVYVNDTKKLSTSYTLSEERNREKNKSSIYLSFFFFTSFPRVSSLQASCRQP